tara:strand:- start:1385 stop:1957 length:573 start_codon:yes stop_codon:yes gene_type:complete
LPDPITILLTAVFVNNFVMVQFLGLCPFMGASNRLDSALGMAAATLFVMTLASCLSYLLDIWFLVPLGLEFLRIILFIVVIAAVVQFAEIVMRASQPRLHQGLGVYVPLITTNCAVLAVALLNVNLATSLLDALFHGAGAGLGFGLVLIMFAAMREHLEQADVPIPFKGTPIYMITAGLLSLAFMGFTGM